MLSDSGDVCVWFAVQRLLVEPLGVLRLQMKLF